MKQQEYKEGAQYVKSFISKIIDKHGPRLPGSVEENAAAEDIRKDFEEATGNECKIENFKMAPYASIGFIPILGLLGFVVFALYYVQSIASLVLGSLVLLFAIIQIFMYKGWFDFLFPKKESKNIYSVIDGGEEIDYTLVYSGHMDSSWNWNLASTKRPQLSIIKTIFGVVGIAVVIGLSLIRVIKGHEIAFDSFEDWFFFVSPIAFIPGIYWLSRYLSYDKKKASPGAMDNLTGVGLSMLMGKYYKDNPDKLPKNCRIIIAGFGSEEAGLKGSIAFMKAHKNDTELFKKPYFLNLDSFRDYDHFNVVKGDLWLMTKFTPELIEISEESIREIGLNPKRIVNPVGGCDSTPIVRAGYMTVTLCAQNPTATDYYHTYNDTAEGLDDRTLEKAYELLINVSDKIHALNAK